MKITQEIVNEIIKRAKASDYGLNEGLTHKNGHLQVDIYSEDMNPYDMLSNLLVNGYDGKYDLISVFKAAFEVLEEEIRKDNKHSLCFTDLHKDTNEKQ